MIIRPQEFTAVFRTAPPKNNNGAVQQTKQHAYYRTAQQQNRRREQCARLQMELDSFHFNSCWLNCSLHVNCRTAHAEGELACLLSMY